MLRTARDDDSITIREGEREFLVHKRMLGKLETVFSYVTRYILHSWPENRPGILFLTDADGCLLQQIPLQVGQKWKPCSFPEQLGESLSKETHSTVAKAIETRMLAVSQEGAEADGCVWAAFPVKEKDGRLREIIGLVLPVDELDMDLRSYMRGLEPLLMMGYDAYIKHVTSEIVMNLNRFDRYTDLVQNLVHEVITIIGKGFCSAVKLDEKGFLLPQERCTTEDVENKNLSHLVQILPSFVNEKITPMTTADRRLAVFPIYCDGKPLTALFLHLPEEEADVTYDERDVAFLQLIGEKISCTLMRTIVSDGTRRDVQKKEMLFQITKKIQASIDVNEVLNEIMDSLNSLYPYFQADLYLTVETNTSLPVKPLTFQPGENETCTRAYMEGRLITNHIEEDGQQRMVIAAPLLGKQGMYGVLQLSTTELVNLTHYETDYISILAETAGTAFENAQLYQQSRNLIRELRLINEMAQQLNRSLNLDEILQFLTKMLLETFEAEYCAILRRLPDEEKLLVLSSSNPEHVGCLISEQERPLQDIMTNKQAIILANPTTETMPFSLDRKSVV